MPLSKALDFQDDYHDERKLMMEDAELLAEVEDLIRTAPQPGSQVDAGEAQAWIGRLSAVLKMWNRIETVGLSLSVSKYQSVEAQQSYKGHAELMVKLQEARFDLRMKSVGPISVAINAGGIFDYFDEMRKLIESAATDIYFVDPYLDAEFISRYLVHVRDGVTIRLLASKKINTLLPAAQAYIQQYNRTISIRTNQGFHDRYVLVDGTSCFQSGASFKDGAKKSPTTLTQITDAFTAIRDTYEGLWQNGKQEL